MKELTNNTFDELFESSNTELYAIDFSATWCGPCKNLAKTLDTVIPEIPDVTFAKADVEECDELADKFKIRNVPTVVFFDKNKNAVHRFSGALPKERILEEIHEALERNKIKTN